VSPRFTTKDLEIEKPKEPFIVELDDGEEFTFPDPKAQSFNFLMSFSTRSPEETIKAILGEDTYAAFLSHPEVNGYFMDYVIKKYKEHFGVLTPG
jgi:hypothetical protein